MEARILQSIKNPESEFRSQESEESGIWNLESGIWNPESEESGIRNPYVLGSLAQSGLK